MTRPTKYETEEERKQARREQTRERVKRYRDNVTQNNIESKCVTHNVTQNSVSNNSVAVDRNYKVPYEMCKLEKAELKETAESYKKEIEELKRIIEELKTKGVSQEELYWRDKYNKLNVEYKRLRRRFNV